MCHNCNPYIINLFNLQCIDSYVTDSHGILIGMFMYKATSWKCCTMCTAGWGNATRLVFSARSWVTGWFSTGWDELVGEGLRKSVQWLKWEGQVLKVRAGTALNTDWNKLFVILKEPLKVLEHYALESLIWIQNRSWGMYIVWCLKAQALESDCPALNSK